MNNTKNNPAVKQAVPFFMVKNIEGSLQFYVERLGFELMNKWGPEGRIEWCWLGIGNASLMLQEYRTGVPPVKLGEGVSVYFMCGNALAVYEQITSQGLSATSEPFVGNNLWVVGLTDPDGYNIYFESPTEVPEGTTYSEWINTVL
jgi:catechol 2,3-dioxygenase-like lactoylglutathione lyase family enzyme